MTTDDHKSAPLPPVAAAACPPCGTPWKTLLEALATEQGGTPDAGLPALLQALVARDNDAADAALSATADLNALNGLALQIAAIYSEPPTLRRLVMAGADIDIAYDALMAQEKELGKLRYYNEYYDDYVYYSSDDQRAVAEISQGKAALEKTLNYFGSFGQIESLRLQHKTLEELRQIRDVITRDLRGQPLDKPATVLRKEPAHGQNG